MASTSSGLSIKLNRSQLAYLFFASLVICGFYLLVSRAKYAIGFPLDDSWIHQTYAKHLALNGEWAFRVGLPSAGSTSPLWSALVSVGYLLKLSPYAWTYFLGALILFLLAILCEVAVRNMAAEYHPHIPWVGIFIVLESRMVWAAMSGMETLLHALVLTTVLILLMTDSRRYLTLGLLTGLSVWVRPDGLTLLGPFLMAVWFIEHDLNSRLIALSRFLIGFGSLFGMYLLFNLSIGGTPMPNTFYAKQVEYAYWQSTPLLERLGQFALQFLDGPGLSLLPGVVVWVFVAIRDRKWGGLAAWLWCLGYLWLYTSRLPVYQHGRYLMPAMPVFFLFGLLAFARFDGRRELGRVRWSIKTIWCTAIIALQILFIFLGADSYSDDVTVIESEMVATAKWAAVNLPAGSVLAAHDIGALGYFDDHPLVDLAGLISPEVIPYIRDESKLALILDENNAAYLIAFPDFYPHLTPGLQVVFTAEGVASLTYRHQNMTVYRWNNP